MTRPTTSAISPFFIVSNVGQTIAFYRDKLGFETRYQDPDQSPFPAIIGRDRAQIFVKSEKDIAPVPNCKRHRHLRWDAFVYAPDPDTLGRRICRSWSSIQRAAQGYQRRSSRLRDLRP